MSPFELAEDAHYAAREAWAPALARVHLRLLATTDLHGQILSYDYYRDRALAGAGLAGLAGLIAAARAEAPGAILLDNGDFLQGSALTEAAADPRSDHPHPAIAAFNALDYDAVALGNHEFNYGLPVLERALAAARFPVLSANVARRLGKVPGEDSHFATPCTIIERELADGMGRRHRIRIGILGLTPPEILHWDRGHVAGALAVRPMIGAARSWTKILRGRGADVVVCLAHTGVPGTGQGARGGRDGGDAHLAAAIAAIDGIDAVIAGHSHTVYPREAGAAGEDDADGFIAGKPVVQPGSLGSHLGVIDLWLGHEGGGWRVREARSRVLNGQREAPALSPQVLKTHARPLQEAAGAAHDAALARMRRHLGWTDIPLSTCFATVASGQALDLTAEALARHVRKRLAGGSLSSLPVVATAIPYRAGGRNGPQDYASILPGPLLLRHVHHLYPFPNTVVARVVTGRALARRIGEGTRILRRLRPGERDQPLIDSAIPASAFETVPALACEIDLTAPPGPGRIRDMRYRGRPVRADDRLILVTNSYLNNRHGHDDGIVLDEGTPCVEVIADFIRRIGRFRGLPLPGWHFTPHAGTSVLFDTGPMAFRHLDEVAALRPEFLGTGAGGFCRFRLHLDGAREAPSAAALPMPEAGRDPHA